MTVRARFAAVVRRALERLDAQAAAVTAPTKDLRRTWQPGAAGVGAWAKGRRHRHQLRTGETR